ncbi:hypothetical protein BH09MYX1_BH09MYX1_17630 [soil metagenome]
MSLRAFATALAFVALTACAGENAAVVAPEGAGGHYLAVHIDSLSDGKAAQFEDARKKWVAEMAKRGTSDARGLFLQTDSNRFYTVRPFARFAELDARADRVARALASVPKDARDEYDHRSDEVLVFPHASEIWELDDELGYAPTANALALEHAACGLLVIEELRPDPTRRARRAMPLHGRKRRWRSRRRRSRSPGFAIAAPSGADVS